MTPVDHKKRQRAEEDHRKVKAHVRGLKKEAVLPTAAALIAELQLEQPEVVVQTWIRFCAQDCR